MEKPSKHPRSLAVYRGLLGKVGPTVEDDIRRAIDRYGAEQVGLALKKLTKRKAGPKTIDDMAELKSIFEEDAHQWLQGKDPFVSRSKYSIAKDMSGKLKGNSNKASFGRVKRKLKTKPFDRKWYTIVAALRISYTQYSYSSYMKALLELSKLDPEWDWGGRLEDAKSTILAYTNQTGVSPAEKLTMQQVEAVVEPIVGALSVVQMSGGD